MWLFIRHFHADLVLFRIRMIVGETPIPLTVASGAAVTISHTPESQHEFISLCNIDECTVICVYVIHSSVVTMLVK